MYIYIYRYMITECTFDKTLSRVILRDFELDYRNGVLAKSYWRSCYQFFQCDVLYSTTYTVRSVRAGPVARLPYIYRRAPTAVILPRPKRNRSNTPRSFSRSHDPRIRVVLLYYNTVYLNKSCALQGYNNTHTHTHKYIIQNKRTPGPAVVSTTITIPSVVAAATAFHPPRTRTDGLTLF